MKQLGINFGTKIPEFLGYGWAFRESDTLENPEIIDQVLHMLKPKRVEKNGDYINALFSHESPDLSFLLPAEKLHVGEGPVDLFSPNLNKELHLGHLRNFITAKSIYNILLKRDGKVKVISYCGTSLGVNPEALQFLKDLFAEHNYPAEIILDNTLELNPDELIDGSGKYEGCKVWKNNPSIVLIKSDGSKTYSYNDLALKQHYSPALYLTGAEQKNHFTALGIAHHIGMGLVLGEDGSKMSSRSGEFLSFKEAIQLTVDSLLPTNADKYKIAYNGLTFHFLSSNIKTNIKYSPSIFESSSGPLYPTFMRAILFSALSKAEVNLDTTIVVFAEDYKQLKGEILYAQNAMQIGVAKVEPSIIAQALKSLCQVVGKFYANEKIHGNHNYYYSLMKEALGIMDEMMSLLGMYILDYV